MADSRPRTIRVVISKELEGKRLDHALAELLPAAAGMPLSKAKVRKLIIAGAVYMNRGRVRIASKIVRTGTRLEVYLDPAKLLALGEREPSKDWNPESIPVLFVDEWLIAVNKPAGLPTQPTLDEARSNLYTLLKKKHEYVGLHHRLDRDTSGVILFTLRKEPNAEVGRLFREHLARKTYWAIVSIQERRGARSDDRTLADRWTVENFLAREKGKAGKMRSVRSGGDAARTEFRVLAKQGSYALVEAKPLTGRMHQIRVHLSEGGMPILGDVVYGGEPEVNAAKVPRVMLHAAELAFSHPITKRETVVAAPLPEDFRFFLSRLDLEERKS
jgi:RluA family pseudouridine synthase